MAWQVSFEFSRFLDRHDIRLVLITWGWTGVIAMLCEWCSLLEVVLMSESIKCQWIRIMRAGVRHESFTEEQKGGVCIYMQLLINDT